MTHKEPRWAGDCRPAAGRCQPAGREDNSSNCEWQAPGKPKVSVMYLEMRDLQSGSLSVSVTPPG